MTLPFVLIMMLLLLGFVAFLGFSEVLSIRSLTQAAADAAALAGASQQRTSTVTLGGQTLCQLPVGIDPEAAEQAAAQYWAANVRGQPFGLVVTDPQNPLNVAFHPNAENATTVSVNPELRLDVLALRILGLENIHWRVYAEAKTSSQFGCQNPFRGPVFDTGGALPPGWPDPQARPVWNFPLAGINAPSSQAKNPDRSSDPGWPVYFVRVFHLDRAQTVTLYTSADDWVQVQVDGQTVPGLDSGFTAGQSEWQMVKQGQVQLDAGDHVLVAKAENGAWGHRSPNPARFVLAAYGDGSLLFDTRPNPYLQGGRPQGKYDWASYSPANPDWTVYLDWRYPSSWISNAGALTQELADAGFTVRNADGLASWMRQAIQDNDAPNTVAVFAQDVAPDTVADQEGPGALIRRYLNAGGNVLWLGDIPFYYQGHANQPHDATQWSQFGEQAILGVPAAAQTFPGQAQATAATGAGQGEGLQAQGNVAEALASVRPLAAGQVGCGVVPLALDGAGNLSGWRLPFSPNVWSSLACTDPMGLGQALANDSPGFVRIYDIGLDGASGSEDADVLAVAGQIAGWYLGQAVSVNWQNPYSGPVFDQGPAGGGVWRRTDWPDANARWIWTFPLAGANAPAGWPVRFARLFTLDQLTTVSFHVAVDDQVLHLWVDGVDETPQGGCAWNRDCTVSMALGQGKHLLVAEAVNAAGSGRFRNPAGFLLTAEDASGNVLFSTAADGSWTSWTAPNPDWVVYSDTNYPAAYGLNAAALAGYLAKAGFTVEDAPGLGAWMRQEIQSGKAPQSVAVLPQGVAPDTVADQESSSALVRQYLNAGGNVLWIGDVPFYYQGHRGWSTTWGNQGLQAILGVGDDARHWDRSVVPQVTTAGAGYGIGLSPYGMQWANEPSTRPMPTYQTPTADGMNCQLENLATNPNGGSSYWRVGYWPNSPDALPGNCTGWDQYYPQAWGNDSPGFIRIYDTVISGQLDVSDPAVERSVLMVSAQMAGWYPGQDTALSAALDSITLSPNPAWAGDTVEATVTAKTHPELLSSVKLDLPWEQDPLVLSTPDGGQTWTGSFPAPEQMCNLTGKEAAFWGLDPDTTDATGHGNDLTQHGGSFPSAGGPCGDQAFSALFRADPTAGGVTLFGVGATSGVSGGEYVLTAASGQHALARLDGSPAQADLVASVRVTVPSSGNAGIVYRTTSWRDANDTHGYYAGLSTSQVMLGRGTNGTSSLWTPLAWAPVSFAPGTSHVLEVTASGPYHQVFVDGKLYLSVTDGWYTGPGQVGLRVWSGQAAFADVTAAGGYLEAPSSSTLNTQGVGLTLDAWVNPASYENGSDVMIVLNKEAQYELGVGTGRGAIPAGAIAFAAEYGSGSNWYWVYSPGGVVPLNKWSEIRAAWDGRTVRFSVNGSPVGSVAYGNGTGIPATSNPLRIGARGAPGLAGTLSSPGSFFVGSIQAVSVIPGYVPGSARRDWTVTARAESVFGFDVAPLTATLTTMEPVAISSVRYAPAAVAQGDFTSGNDGWNQPYGCLSGPQVTGGVLTISAPNCSGFSGLQYQGGGTFGSIYGGQVLRVSVSYRTNGVVPGYLFIHALDAAGTWHNLDQALGAPDGWETYRNDIPIPADWPGPVRLWAALGFAPNTGSGLLQVDQVSLTPGYVMPDGTFAPAPGQDVRATVLASGPVQSVSLGLPWNGQQVALGFDGGRWTGTFPAPSATGTWDVTATVSSDAPQSLTRAGTLVVYQPPVKITGFALSPDPASPGQTVLATVTASGSLQSVQILARLPGQTYSANWPASGWSFTSPTTGTGTLQITVWNVPSYTPVWLNDLTAGTSQFLGSYGNISPQTFTYSINFVAGHAYSVTYTANGGNVSWVSVTTAGWLLNQALTWNGSAWTGSFAAPGMPVAVEALAQGPGGGGDSAVANLGVNGAAAPGKFSLVLQNGNWSTANPPPATWLFTSPVTGTATVTITVWNGLGFTVVKLYDQTAGTLTTIGPSGGFGNDTAQTFTYQVQLQAGHGYAFTYANQQGSGTISYLAVSTP